MGVVEGDLQGGTWVVVGAASLGAEPTPSTLTQSLTLKAPMPSLTSSKLKKNSRKS